MRPDPDSDVLARRILEAGNVIQIIVIELLLDRRKRQLDVRKVHDPSGWLRDFALNKDGDLKRVTMQSCALVSFGDVRKAVGRFECELFKD